VARWGNRHASALSTHGLNLVTQLGSIYVVVALCVVLVAVETVRTRSAWIVPFIVAVIGGEEILTRRSKNSQTGCGPPSTPPP
jgi:hypothetical protein